MGRGDHFRKVTNDEIIESFEKCEKQHQRHGFTYTEIAANVEITPEAVRQRLSRLLENGDVESERVGNTVLWKLPDRRIWA